MHLFIIALCRFILFLIVYLNLSIRMHVCLKAKFLHFKRTAGILIFNNNDNYYSVHSNV